MNAAIYLAAAIASTNPIFESRKSDASVIKPAIDWSTILDAHFENGNLVLRLGPLFVGLAVLAAAATLIWRYYYHQQFTNEFEIVEAELEIAHIGKIKIKPNRDNIQIAHEAWVELTTRNAALPFDDKNDLIVEIYNSYYQLFGRLRDMTKKDTSLQAARLPEHKKAG